MTWTSNGWNVAQVGDLHILIEQNEAYPGVRRVTATHVRTDRATRHYEVGGDTVVKPQRFSRLRCAIKAAQQDA
jgi:hypothetical protein